MDALKDEIDLLKDKVGENRKIIQIMSEQIKKRDEIIEEATELIQYFVDRVEAGTIRSRTTYKKYKDFLDKINKLKSEL